MISSSICANHRRTHPSRLAHSVLNIGDLVTTKLALHGGAIEGNPLSSVLISHGALNPAKFLTLAVLAWCISRTPPRLFSTVAVWFVAGVYTMVIASNLLVYANTA